MSPPAHTHYRAPMSLHDIPEALSTPFHANSPFAWADMEEEQDDPWPCPLTRIDSPRLPVEIVAKVVQMLRWYYPGGLFRLLRGTATRTIDTIANEETKTWHDCARQAQFEAVWIAHGKHHRCDRLNAAFLSVEAFRESWEFTKTLTIMSVSSSLPALLLF